MDKDNIFCSSKFWMSDGDKLHVIIKDLVGTMPQIELYDEDGNTEDDYTPPAPPLYEEIEYGALYNWYAATDVREIAADGWHVPTEAEIITFYTFLDAAVAGGKCKETGLTYWFSPNTGATNETGFNGRGSGIRIYNTGVYSNMLSTGNWWLTTPHPSDPSMAYTFNFSRSDALINNTSNGQRNEGMAIRLIKDSTTLSDGEGGSYTGNDGKVYRTICIGTQEWLADNLAETKFRNGDDIPIVTDNAAWAGLVTGAMCYYNNDESYA